MVLIRGLLLDAEDKFRRMVEDNRQLAAHIDGSIRAANQEVGMLRSELASTNKRLSQISFKDTMGKADATTQIDKSPTRDDAELRIETLTNANQQLLDDYKHLLEEHDDVKVSITKTKLENETLKSENAKLQDDFAKVVRENEEIRQIKADNGEGGKGKPSYGELKLELIQTRQELRRAKEVLQELKNDRKRLKGEKLDLLSQMKQLYSTLEEKETELREFIRNYEQRVKESDDMIKQLAREKEETDHEKWDIITKAREAAEKAMFFQGQLESKEQQLKTLEGELSEAKKMLDNLGQTFPSPTRALSSSMGSSCNSNENNNFLMNNLDSYSISSTGEDSCLLNYETPTASSTAIHDIPGPSSSTPAITVSNDAIPALLRLSSQASTISEIDSVDSAKSNGGKGNDDAKKKKKGLSGLTRVFSRGRLRRSIALTKDETIDSLGMTPSCAKLRILSEDNYQEKLSIVEHMVGLNMVEWRAHQVLAWLEITLAMPMYAIACLHNIKSGRVLLGLSDSELSAALGVSNHIHRRKLRLSIEQHRNPSEIKYPKANEMDPTWIAHRFLPDLGLPQYTRIFEEQLCDGHIVNTLTRRDLEKYFSVHRKFHQSSIMHAVELLRRIDFNKEKLYKRRTLSEESDTDLIVWTNERFLKWIRSIDLGEYGDSLKDSGVHGALVVLEPSFCSDTLSSILGIPPSKSYIRRHLDAELENILKPARAALDSPEIKIDHEEEENQTKKKLQRTSSQDDNKIRRSFRGSIGKAFGKKAKNELKKTQDSDPLSKKTISSPVLIQHSSLSSLDNTDLLKKGFCIPAQCVNPETGAAQGCASDLQKSFQALSSVIQQGHSSSEEKSPLRKSEEKDKSSKPTVIDLVKDLKMEADMKSKAKDGGSKSTILNTNNNLLTSSETNNSLVSSSSQDTLTEQPVNVSSPKKGKGRKYLDKDMSQTESVSQSSSTESALEDKRTSSIDSSYLPSDSHCPKQSNSSDKSSVDEITAHIKPDYCEGRVADCVTVDRNTKLISNRNRNSQNDGYSHSTQV